jgi:hypothetical protein
MDAVAADARGAALEFDGARSWLERARQRPMEPLAAEVCTPAGVTLRAVRADRILDETHETEDPVHLVRVFGISVTTAMKYIHTAHPHRAGPIPR